jgi:membrane protein
MPVSPQQGPDSPTELPKRSWWSVLKRAVKEFQADAVTDWAAALTYYGVLSIFPGLLVLTTLFGMLSESANQKAQQTATQLAPGGIGDLLKGAIDGAHDNNNAAGILAIVGLVLAFWSASGYIAAFIRAANAIYDVPEGRPIWKTLPIRLGVTAVVGVMLVISAAIVVFTGDLARTAGDLIGVGSGAVTVWSILKWPVLVVLVSLMFSILYWASPNARHGGFKWVSPGGVFAVISWLIVSAAFALYLATFANYNKTYGTVGGIIIFLVWLWLTNVAILLGAEFDAELERSRAIAAGHPDDEEPFLELRDDRKLKKDSGAGLGN